MLSKAQGLVLVLEKLTERGGGGDRGTPTRDQQELRAGESQQGSAG